jgi:hypothetical protein
LVPHSVPHKLHHRGRAIEIKVKITSTNIPWGEPDEGGETCGKGEEPD